MIISPCNYHGNKSKWDILFFVVVVVVVVSFFFFFLFFVFVFFCLFLLLLLLFLAMVPDYGTGSYFFTQAHEDYVIAGGARHLLSASQTKLEQCRQAYVAGWREIVNSCSNMHI